MVRGGPSQVNAVSVIRSPDWDIDDHGIGLMVKINLYARAGGGNSRYSLGVPNLQLKPGVGIFLLTIT